MYNRRAKERIMKIDLTSDLFPREKYLTKIRGFYHECEIIKVLSGVRRSGKSSILTLIARELLASGVKEENILFFNLDKRPYRGIDTPDKLDKLIEEHADVQGVKYLFVDEVQNVEGFEPVLNSWREEGDFSIFVTGSNSYLLSGELVTKLTGRYLEFNVLPLSFDEYLLAKEHFHKPVSQDNLTELKNYILEGGFPYAVKLDGFAEKREYVKGLIEEIYEKDIKRRIQIRNREAFESVMFYIIGNFGKAISVNNIVDDLQKKGIAIKATTIRRYIDALESTKIILPCRWFDLKTRRAIGNERKYYLSDLSFFYALSTDNRIYFGPALENIVYNYAFGLGYSISIGRVGKLECDFILRSPEGDYSYVQVAYTILASEETEEREYRPLESITWDNYPRYLLTTDALLQKRNGIIHANLMDFIKEGKRF